MDELRQWALTVCGAAVICTLLGRLFPDTSLGRQGRLMLPCVFLCIMLSPLLSMSVYLPTGQAQTTGEAGAALEARMRQQLVAQLNNTLLDMVNQALDSYGVKAEKVVTDMDIGEDGRIDIGQITIYVNEKAAKRSVLVKQVAEKRLGMAVTVAQMEDRGWSG